MERHRALVVSVGSRSARVHVDDLGELRCVIRGNLFKQNTWETKPIAVGDRVTVEVGTDAEDAAAIVAVEERSNQLA